MTPLTGNDIKIFRALAVARALELYAETGIRVNRAYTPSAMMAVASEITQLAFKPRDYTKAAEALRTWAALARPLSARERDSLTNLTNNPQPPSTSR